MVPLGGGAAAAAAAVATGWAAGAGRGGCGGGADGGGAPRLLSSVRRRTGSRPRGVRGAPGFGLACRSGLFLGQTRFFLGRLAGLGFAPARFLGGGEDRDLLLLAAFGFAPGGVALLFVQRPLPGGQFGGGQRAPGTRRRPAGGAVTRGAGAARLVAAAVRLPRLKGWRPGRATCALPPPRLSTARG